MSARLAWAPLLAAALLLPSSAARAQSVGAIALNQLDPTPAGDAFFGVPSPGVGGHLVPRGAITFDHAGDPFLVQEGTTTSAIVGSQSSLHVGASLALWDRLQVSAQLPFAVAQGGDSPTAQSVPFSSPSSAALGDLRLGLRVRLFGGDFDPFQAGVGLYVHVPTAPADTFTGDGSVREAPHVLLGGSLPWLVWSATAGFAIRASSNPSTFTFGGAAAARLLSGMLQVGPEIYGATQIQDGSIQVTARKSIDRTATTNAEALLGVRVRLLDRIVIGAAGGPGLTQAIGTPSFRVVGTFAWAPGGGAARPAEDKTLDTDGDGTPDTEDACPYAFGAKSSDPKWNGCPTDDGDEDGVVDLVDACPDKPGQKSADAKVNGCPTAAGAPTAAMAPALADSDGDSVPDAQDACPKEKGELTKDATTAGCPAAAPTADSDGDGVPNAEDACPKDKGAATGDANTANVANTKGCPKYVRVTETAIEMSSPIQFRVLKNDMAPLDPSAEPILTEVRDAIAQHPELLKLEVQAHTDDSGDKKFNETISTARAEAVRKWLVDHGVPADKLTAKGYGPSKPIADNKTAAGRAKNKRIQIVVLEKK